MIKDIDADTLDRIVRRLIMAACVEDSPDIKQAAGTVFSNNLERGEEIQAAILLLKSVGIPVYGTGRLEVSYPSGLGSIRASVVDRGENDPGVPLLVCNQPCVRSTETFYVSTPVPITIEVPHTELPEWAWMFTGMRVYKTFARIFLALKLLPGATNGHVRFLFPWVSSLNFQPRRNVFARARRTPVYVDPVLAAACSEIAAFVKAGQVNNSLGVKIPGYAQ